MYGSAPTCEFAERRQTTISETGDCMRTLHQRRSVDAKYERLKFSDLRLQLVALPRPLVSCAATFI